MLFYVSCAACSYSFYADSFRAPCSCGATARINLIAIVEAAIEHGDDGPLTRLITAILAEQRAARFREPAVVNAKIAAEARAIVARVKDADTQPTAMTWLGVGLAFITMRHAAR